MTNEMWFNTIQIIITILGFLGVGFIPQFYYRRKLDKINNEVKKLHISVEKNHPIKTERYSAFVENFFQNGKIKNEAERQRKMLDDIKKISNAVFLYGSDETLRAFLVLRTQDTTLTEHDNFKTLADTAKFMVCLRKDLNGGFTNVTAEDYLKLVLNDWEQSKHKILKFL